MFATENGIDDDIYDSVEINVIGNKDFQVSDPKSLSEKSDEENSQENGGETVKPETVTDPVTQEKIGQTADEPEEKSEVKHNVPVSESVIMSHMAKYFAENKELTGLDLPENPTIDDFYEKFKEVVISKEISNGESTLIAELRENIIEEEGLDERTVAIATGINYGIDRNEYRDLIAINEFADNEFAVSPNQQTQLLFEIYHRLNQVKESDIPRYVGMDMSSIDEDLIEERVAFLRKHSEDGIRDIQRTIDARKQKYVEYRDKKVATVRDLLQKRSFAGRDYTKEQIDIYIKGTSGKTEEIEMPNGLKVKVTPFEKKKFDYENKNFEESLADSIDFYLGLKTDKVEKIKEKQEKVVAGKFMTGLLSDLKDSKLENTSVKYKEDDDDGDVVKIGVR